MPNGLPELYPVPVGAVDRTGVGWWGLVCAIATEVALFGYAIFTYAYIAVQLDPAEVHLSRLSFQYSVPMTAIVIVSSIALVWAEYGVRRRERLPLVLGLLAALLLALGFVALEYFEWTSQKFTPSSLALGSAYYVTTGLHLAHFVAGIILLAFMVPLAALGYFDDVRHAHVAITAAYWHFVNVMWVVLFIALYVVPYIG